MLKLTTFGLLLLICSALAFDVCKYKIQSEGPHKGKTVDLNRLAKKGGGANMVDTGGWTYHVNFCSETNVDCAGNTNFMSIQRYEAATPPDCNPLSMEASSAETSIQIKDEPAPSGGEFPIITISYTGGAEGRQSIFTCQCDKNSETTVKLANQSPTSPNYPFEVVSKYCCPGSSGGGGNSIPLGNIYGLGGLFITLLIVFIILFFVVGVVVQLVRGERSIRIIPFFDYLKDIPILIWLGISWLPVVIINLVKKKTGGGQQLYDSA